MKKGAKTDTELLRDVAGLALRRARERADTHWLSLRSEVFVPDHLALFAADDSPASECFYWSQPDRGLTMIGFGATHEIAVRGAERFAAAGAALGGS